MFSKVVVLLVCLSVVKATIFTINAYEDENNEISDVADESAVRTVRSCGYAECNAFCRKMGYARGVCIGTYCQCRMRSSAAAVEIPKPESDEIAEPSSKAVRICNLRECAQSCRRIGFRSGVCVNGRCKCDILRSASPLSESDFESDEIAEPSSKAVRICNLRECAQSCRRIGFRGGACVNGRCKCDILHSASPLSESDFESDDIAEPSSKAVITQKICNQRECAQYCPRIGFRGGVCVNGRCKCNIRRSALPASALTASEDNNDEFAMDANPKDDATAAGDDSSENNVD